MHSLQEVADEYHYIPNPYEQSCLVVHKTGGTNCKSVHVIGWSHIIKLVFLEGASVSLNFMKSCFEHKFGSLRKARVVSSPDGHAKKVHNLCQMVFSSEWAWPSGTGQDYINGTGWVQPLHSQQYQGCMNQAVSAIILIPLSLKTDSIHAFQYHWRAFQCHWLWWSFSFLHQNFHTDLKLNHRYFKDRFSLLIVMLLPWPPSFWPVISLVPDSFIEESLVSLMTSSLSCS